MHGVHNSSTTVAMVDITLTIIASHQSDKSLTVPNIKHVAIPKREREIDVVVHWEADPARGFLKAEHVERVVQIPKRVWLKRNLGSSYEVLYVSRG
jgi:hypothetical protein